MTVSRKTGRLAAAILSAALAVAATGVAQAGYYVRYDIRADRADGGYPKAVDNGTWPGLFANGHDAAVNWGNGKAYFFGDRYYVRYDIAADRVDPGYPKAIDAGTWPGIFSSGNEAVTNWGNGKAYFFAR